MAKFIKLTHLSLKTDKETAVYLNSDEIKFITARDDGSRSCLSLKSTFKDVIWVKETPEEIFELIEGNASTF